MGGGEMFLGFSYKIVKRVQEKVKLISFEVFS